MGNVFTTLKNIDMIGRNLDARDGAGGCGKEGKCLFLQAACARQ